MKKQVVRAVFLLCILLSYIATGVSAAENTTEFAGGEGTEASPYLVATKAHLNNVRKYPSAHFKMVEDILFDDKDFSRSGSYYNGGKGWLPIGERSNAFSGVFDGDGHIISNLFCKQSVSESEYVALFRYVTNATIKNLFVTDVDILVTTSSMAIPRAAAIAGGAASSSILNCGASGEISTSMSGKWIALSGGIVGQGTDTIIENCYNLANVTAEDRTYGTQGTTQAGGIGGNLDNCQVANCFNYGTITAGSNAGGIVGNSSGTSIASCYNVGDISCESSAGGIIGYVYKAADFTGCYYLDTCPQGAGNYSDGFICCSDDWMKQEDALTELDFTSIWTMDGNPDYLYPELQDVEMIFQLKARQLSVLTQPETLIYHTGETLDPTGLTLAASYNNGTAEEITGKDCSFSYDFTEAGQKTVEVSYRGAVTSFSVTVLSSIFDDGYGAEESPYLISNAAQMDRIRDDLDAHYKLICDISFAVEDFSASGAFYNDGAGWLPIGSTEEPFTGVLDGDGHTISGLVSNLAPGVYGAVYAGLFGYTSGAEIRDLDMMNAGIAVSAKQSAYAGTIVGCASKTTMDHCTVSGNEGTVTASSTGDHADVFAGGIAGYITGSKSELISCYSAASIKTTAPKGEGSLSYAGGIVGFVDDTGCTIERCYNIGSVSGTTSHFSNARAGGIVGYMNYGTIDACYNAGTVLAATWIDSHQYYVYANAGGIAGGGDNLSIKNCYNAGAVSAQTRVSGTYRTSAFAGGIAGRGNGSITTSYSVGTVTATGTSGSQYTDKEYIAESTYSITDCYYLGGYTYTVEELWEAETYSGFNFTFVWTMGGNPDYFFPELRQVDMVYNKKAAALTLESLPEKQNYFAGDDLDTTGLVVNLEYADGSSDRVPLTALSFDYDFSKAGQATVTLTRSGLTASFEVNVLPKLLLAGSGSDEDPYLISTAEQLDIMRMHPDKHFRLAEDIVFTESDFVEDGIFYNEGMGWRPITDFTGTFDGNGHVITGLQSNTRIAGLFGVVRNAAICNLGMIDASITAVDPDGSAYAGAIAGSSHSTSIRNCYSTGTIKASATGEFERAYAGGLVGSSDKDTIENCYTMTTVSARATEWNCNPYAAGIAGNTTKGSVASCYSIGTVSAKAGSGISNSHGIANGSCTIQNCYFPGSAYTKEDLQKAETFAGFDFTDVWTMEGNADYYYPELQKVTMVYSKTLTGIAITALPDKVIYRQDETPHFIGLEVTASYESHVPAVITDYTLSYDFSQVGETQVTVSCGDYRASFSVLVISKLFAEGSGLENDPYLITSAEELDNVRQHPDAYYKLTADIVFSNRVFAYGGDFYNQGAGWEPIGSDEEPFTGDFDGNGHIITGLQIHSDSASGDVLYAGLFGYTRGIIENLGLADAEIIVKDNTGTAYVGGIAGYNAGSISGCYSTGSVSLSNRTATSADTGYIGGIAGYSAASISNCFNVSAVSSASTNLRLYAGGVTGYSKGTMSSCYNIGAVAAESAGSSSFGGVAGYAYPRVTNCYSLDLSAAYAGGGAKNCTMAEMKQAATFYGFDFTDVWTMSGVDNYPYPELQGVEMHYSRKLVSVSVTALPRTIHYDVGEQLNTDGLKVIALYDDDSTEMITDYALSYDFSAAGEATVTVTYQGKTADFKVCVNDGLFSGGLGTEQYPYLIGSAQELEEIRSRPFGNYRLITDIVFSRDDFSRGGAFYNSGTGWEPIGKSSAPFTGTLDGGGHTISGLYINQSEAAANVYAGLFGITDGAAICDLTLRNVDITVDTDTDSCVGGMVGSARNTEIEGCHITGTILSRGAADARVGGIAGYSSRGTISRCSNASAVIAESNHPKGLSDYDAYAGGILGYGLSSDISACYNIGSVTAESLKNEAYAGGILGETCLSIINCFNAGTVTAKAYDDGYKYFQNAAYAGGISAVGGDTITCCYNVGDVFASSAPDTDTEIMVRGITCYASWPKQISNCYYIDSLPYGVNTSTSYPDTSVRCTRWQMTEASTFRGFNFGSVWTMGDSSEYPYPVLRGVEMVSTSLNTSKTDDGVRVALNLMNGLTADEVYLLAAAYDGDGQLCGEAKVFTADALRAFMNGGKEITFSSHHSCGVFLTDLNFKPLLEADFVQ